MANVFTVDTVNSPSTTGSTVLALNATTTAVVLGCIVANTTSITGTATIELYDDSRSTTVTLVKDAEIPVGGALELLSGGKVVLDNSDQIRVKVGSTTHTVDVALSTLQQS